MEWIPWDVGRDGVVVRVGLGYEGKGKGEMKKHAFRPGKHIRLLFQGHSPGGATGVCRMSE